VAMKSTIFWDVTSCGPVVVNRRFGGKTQEEIDSFLFGLLFDPEDGYNIFLRKFFEILPDYTVLLPRR
jgi:hypothetical protein